MALTAPNCTMKIIWMILHLVMVVFIVHDKFLGDVVFRYYFYNDGAAHGCVRFYTVVILLALHFIKFAENLCLIEYSSEQICDCDVLSLYAQFSILVLTNTIANSICGSDDILVFSMTLFVWLLWLILSLLQRDNKSLPDSILINIACFAIFPLFIFLVTLPQTFFTITTAMLVMMLACLFVCFNIADKEARLKLVGVYDSGSSFLIILITGCIMLYAKYE